MAVGPAVREYLVSLAHATRSHRRVTLGLSPRGLLIWQRVALARAFLSRRDFVIPDDVQVNRAYGRMRLAYLQGARIGHAALTPLVLGLS